MKILIICYEDMGGFIGGVRQVIEIGKHLHKLGHEVEIACPGIRECKEEVNFKIHYIPVVHKKIFQPLSFHLFSFFYLINIFRNFKPDIFFAFEIFCSPISMLVSKLFKRPYMIFVNGSIEDFELKRMSKFIIRLIDLVRKINFKFCDTVFTVTETLKQDLTKQYKYPAEKIIVLNNGVDIDYFQPLDRDLVCRKLGLDINYTYVGFLGGMWPWHGLEALVKSAPLVLKSLFNVRFIIAGHGPEKDRLTTLIKELGLEEYFFIVGEVAFSKVPVYINSFDVCILFFKPVRRNQGSPIKLFEYLACGKPVIASRLPGYGLLLEEIGAGLAVNSEDPADVARTLINLLENKSQRDRMSISARQAAVNNFTWQNTVSKIEKILISYD